MSNVTSILNDLIETSRDGEKVALGGGHRERGAQSRLSGTCAGLRKSAADLQQRVTRLGGNPESGGSVAGAVHRGWVNLKASVTGRSDLAILEECERGEDVAKARYRKLSKQTCPTIFEALSNVSMREW